MASVEAGGRGGLSQGAREREIVPRERHASDSGGFGGTMAIQILDRTEVCLRRAWARRAILHE